MSRVYDPEKKTITPYAGSSGWSGSEASKECADAEDGNGIMSKRQSTVLDLLRQAQESGLTWRELSARTGWHHGQATPPLSTLHKVGLISRLREKRGKCSVYVLPEYVEGRETAAQGRKSPPLTLAPNARIDALTEALTLSVSIFRKSGHKLGHHDPSRCPQCLAFEVLNQR